jgi:hypothetical protein
MLTVLRCIVSSGPLLWMLVAFALSGQSEKSLALIATPRDAMPRPSPLHTSLIRYLDPPLLHPLSLREALPLALDLAVSHRRET